MHITFDFDGTIAKTTEFHRIGWKKTLEFLCIDKTLEEFLPYEKGALGRFDSYEKIKNSIMSNPNTYKLLCSKFGETNPFLNSYKIMDIKEGFTVSEILNQSHLELVSYLATNFMLLLDNLVELKATVGVLSSSRKLIVSSYLSAVHLTDYFKYILGEEDLYNSENCLLDKPNRYGGKVIKEHIGTLPNFYIGDNDTDKHFARNIGVKYLHLDYSQDSTQIVDNIYEAKNM